MGWLRGLTLMVVLMSLSGCASAPQPASMAHHTGGKGGLQFLVDPADSQIYIDADYKGLASQYTGDHALWLPLGMHAIEIRREGYLTFFRQVQVSHGLLEVLVFTMKVNDELP